jgi:hypothetical protein
LRVPVRVKESHPHLVHGCRPASLPKEGERVAGSLYQRKEKEWPARAAITPCDGSNMVQKQQLAEQDIASVAVQGCTQHSAVG